MFKQSEQWVKQVEEIAEKMSGTDIWYADNFIWCGNDRAEAWFYPDGTCLAIIDDDVRSISIKDAADLLVEQPPEDLFRQEGWW